MLPDAKSLAASLKWQSGGSANAVYIDWNSMSPTPTDDRRMQMIDAGIEREESAAIDARSKRSNKRIGVATMCCLVRAHHLAMCGRNQIRYPPDGDAVPNDGRPYRNRTSCGMYRYRPKVR